jgi:hypothetical protein
MYPYGYKIKSIVFQRFTCPTERKIVAHLRADKALPKETAEALIKMIKLAYKAHE